jgi:Radical SAM superfamily
MTEFPIKTATSCLLKWTWSTIMLSRSETSSCHRVDHLPLTLENFKNFHNLPKKIDDRTKMLNGERPIGGCEYCFKIEDAGGFSDRQHNLKFTNLNPIELTNDKTATKVTPRILEVYFNNTCNLSCLYCGPHFSSVWENEYKKFGEIKGIENVVNQMHEFENNKDYNEMIKLFWEWMDENSKNLRKFQILGGEPFFQPEFINCLDHFEKYPNPECEFIIITNLMVDDKRMDFYIERFKKLIGKRKLKGLQITCSLDCWGPQAEYIRSGLDLAQWQRNFEKLLQLKWVRLQINHAINGLSIKYMTELIEKVNEWNKIKKVFLNFMTVVNPTYMNPDIFGNLFTADLEKIKQLLPNNSPFDKSTIEYFDGMSKQISKSQINPEEIAQLKIFLTEIDRRRNTDYRKLFPWLVKIFENNA